MNFNNMGPISPYPLNAFPEEIRSTIWEVAWQTKVQEEQAGMSVMAAVSLAGQDLADIQMTYGGEVPCLLTFIALIISGGRKTAVTNKVFRPVRLFEAQCEAEWLEVKAHYDLEHPIWQIRQKALELALGKVVNNRGEEITLAEDQLREHRKLEPKLPPLSRRMLKDCTPDALKWHLHDVYPSVAFIVDEGGNFFNGRAAGQLTFLNEAWDGATISVTRKSSESFVLRGARVTSAIMIQLRTFEAFLKGQGALARDNGYLARALICAPASTLGFRQESSIETPECPCLDNFTARIVEMLKVGHAARVKGDVTRSVLMLSQDAKVHLRDFGNYIETNLRQGGLFCEVPDAASKTVENAVRMAGLFHLYLNHEGPVSQDLVQRACQIVEWHLFEFRRLFVPPPEVPLSIKDPMDLDASIRRQFNKFGRSQYTRSSLQAYAPSALRHNRSRLIAATETLIQCGIMSRYQQPGSRSIWFAFNPQMYPYNPGVFNH